MIKNLQNTAQQDIIEKLTSIIEEDDIDTLNELIISNSKEIKMYLGFNNHQVFKLACEYESLDVIDKLWQFYQELYAVSKSNGLHLTLKILLEEQFDAAFIHNRIKTLDYILSKSGLYKNEAVYPKLVVMLKNLNKNSEKVVDYILDYFDKPNVFTEQIMNNYDNSHMLGYFLRSNQNVIAKMLDRKYLVKPVLLYLNKNASLMCQNRENPAFLLDKISNLKNISSKYLSKLYSEVIATGLYSNNEELLRYFIIDKNCPQNYIENIYKEQLQVRPYAKKELKECKKNIEKIYDTKNLYLKIESKVNKKDIEEPIKRKKI
jgi:hypothetical protein